MAIHRGEIYLVNLSPVKEREQAGQRPVLVLSIDKTNQQPLVVTVVVGTKGENVTRDYPTNYAAYMSGEEPEDENWVLDFGEWASVYRTWLARKAEYRAANLSIPA